MSEKEGIFENEKVMGVMMANSSVPSQTEEFC